MIKINIAFYVSQCPQETVIKIHHGQSCSNFIKQVFIIYVETDFSRQLEKVTSNTIEESSGN